MTDVTTIEQLIEAIREYPEVEYVKYDTSKDIVHIRLFGLIIAVTANELFFNASGIDGDECSFSDQSYVIQDYLEWLAKCHFFKQHYNKMFNVLGVILDALQRGYKSIITNRALSIGYDMYRKITLDPISYIDYPNDNTTEFSYTSMIIREYARSLI